MNVVLKKIAFRLNRELIHLVPHNRPRKILFDHLPKCGGSTLNTYLESHYPKRKIYTVDGRYPSESVKIFKEFNEKKRHEFSLIKGHLSNELIHYTDPSCIKITVLRDPVDRIISHYFYVKRTPVHYLYSKVNNSAMSLEDYVSSNLSDELQNYYVSHFSGLSSDEIQNNPEKSIETAIDNLKNNYDIVGFLDDFNLFINNLRAQGNLKFQYTNSKVNVTKNRPNIDKIPRSTIELIESVNRLDMLFYKNIQNTITLQT